MISVTVVDESGQETYIPGKPEASPWVGCGLASKNSGTLEGWWTSPEPRAEAIARPQADGAFAPIYLRLGARIVTLVFHTRQATRRAHTEMKNLVARWGKQWIRLIVNDEGEVRHVRGFVSEIPDLSKIDERTATFSLVLTCPDPLKYGGPGSDDDALPDWEVAVGRFGNQGVGGLLFPVFEQAPRDEVSSTSEPTARFTETGMTNTVTVVNEGNSGTWPVLEAVGPFSWVEWTLGEQVVRWASSVPAGYLLQINTQTGEIRIGGERVTPAGLVSDQFSQLPPGQSSVAFMADRPVTYRVKWLNAWM